MVKLVAWLLVSAAAIATPGWAAPTRVTPYKPAAPAAPAVQPERPRPAPAAIPVGLAEAMQRFRVPWSDVTLLARAVGSDEEPIAWNDDRLFMLASTTKLVTTLASLDLLGPAFRWRTSVTLHGPLKDGRLEGDLVIAGGGDPLLDAEQLREWFLKMRKRGLREIAGNIVLDRRAFRFEERDHINTPQPDWSAPHRSHPDALLVNEGVMHVEVQSANGDAPFIRLTPNLPNLAIDDRVNREFTRCAEVRRPISVQWMAEPAPGRVLIEGDWAKDCAPARYALSPLRQDEYSRRAIAALWRETGGLLQGSVIEQPPPDPPAPGQRLRREPLRRIWMTLESAPLMAALREVNKWSNNLVSRQVFLALSPDFPRKPATMKAARETLDQWLIGRGLTNQDIQLDNGSGLARIERGTARALARLLVDAWGSTESREFVATLAIAGVDGTMGNRLKSTEASGNAYLKTGTLFDVRAVAGFVKARSGKTYSVVAIVNHPEASRLVPAIDAFIEWLHAHH